MFAMIQFITVQQGLAFKVDTGTELTRITAISAAKRNGWTFARNSRVALRDINAMAVAMGREPKWSKKFGDESNLPGTIEIKIEAE